MVLGNSLKAIKCYSEYIPQKLESDSTPLKFDRRVWNAAQALREKCPNTEFFLVWVFLHWDWIRRLTPWIQENTDQKKLRICTLFTQWNSLANIRCYPVSTCCLYVWSLSIFSSKFKWLKKLNSNHSINWWFSSYLSCSCFLDVANE